MKRVLGLTLLMLGFAAQAGQVYKWTDDKGRMHYGDKPGATAAKKVDVKPPGNPPLPASSEDASAARSKACQEKRDQLSNYEKAQSIVEQDALGNKREYSADERQKLLARARQQVDQACKAAPPPSDQSAEGSAEKAEPSARSEPVPPKE